MSRSKASWRRRVGRVTVYRRGTRYWIYYRQGWQIRKPVGTKRDVNRPVHPTDGPAAVGRVTDSRPRTKR